MSYSITLELNIDSNIIIYLDTLITKYIRSSTIHTTLNKLKYSLIGNSIKEYYLSK